jgi:glutamate-1-semialdehyde 2,1-aminomutase
MKTVAIIQARTLSKRLPNKVMKFIGDTPIIELLIKRLSRSKELDDIMVATSNNSADDELANYIDNIGVNCYRGSEDDVLLRYINAGKKIKADIVVRITGDCPLVDPKIVDQCIVNFKKINIDHYSNIFPPTFPDGLDVEVFKLDTLIKIQNFNLSKEDKEHITKFIIDNNSFTKKNLFNSENLSHLRWTLDEKKDLSVIEKIFNNFSPNIHFTWQDVLELYKNNEDLFLDNLHIKRNEGSKFSNGQKLWRRAKSIIPGGNMLLSKRPDLFLPNKWPPYFKKAKGCEIWDIDGKKFFDLSLMGVGTNILGYSNEEVDKEVINSIKNGNMSSLNCTEEVDLSDKLINMHPWADMAKLARTGGEANSIAIRIARAACGKDKIAVCGYHGWHDWYLSANLKHKKNLDDHLIAGLNIGGVPKGLEGTVFTFKYNDYEALEKIVQKEDIGIIKMEVMRNIEPSDNFLEKIRSLCTNKNIILIFDECTSGFRETFGGLHKKFNINPDIAIFGKALGNGYAITAVIGKGSLMKYAESSFISSTFWTERIGPTAALKTLEIMEREKSWDKITNTGKYIRKQWKEISKKYQIDINISGISALSSFTFSSKNNIKYKTLITQEMLKKGFLAANTIYVCTEHNKEIVNEYLSHLDDVFKLIKKCEDGKSIDMLLENQVSNSGFERLN